jgi:hypothetical protein
LDGLEKLGDALDKVQELRLLIGTEPDQEFLLTQRLWRELERHLALISPHAQQMLERWSAFLRQDKVQVRRYVPREHGRMLHGKAYLLLGVPAVRRLGRYRLLQLHGRRLDRQLGAERHPEAAERDRRIETLVRGGLGEERGLQTEAAVPADRVHRRAEAVRGLLQGAV